MSTKEKLIALGADKLADMLVALSGKNKDVLKDMNMMMVTMAGDPKKVASLIRKEIASLKKSTKYISCKESSSVSQRLDNIRKRISNEMLSLCAKTAFELMLDFVGLHEQTMERSDDSNGLIGDVFCQSCKDLGKISEKASLPQTKLIDIVFSRLMNNPYCIYDKIISCFADSLTKESLLELKSKFTESLSGLSEFSKSEVVRTGLKSIADILKDVDAFISTCSIFPESLERQVPEIVRRLLDSGRSKEALEWLDRYKTNKSCAYYNLRVEALENVGEHDKAQKERMEWFEKNLSIDAYQGILRSASPDFATNFKMKAIQLAHSNKDPYVSLSFLNQIHDLVGLSRFIRMKPTSLEDMNYRFLRPIAEKLQSSEPLAATVVYREMIDAILDKGKSKYYKYAASDVVKCCELSGFITDWESFQNHNEYFADLQSTHSSKRKFWSEYEDAVLNQSQPAAKRRRV